MIPDIASPERSHMRRGKPFWILIAIEVAFFLALLIGSELAERQHKRQVAPVKSADSQGPATSVR